MLTTTRIPDSRSQQNKGSRLPGIHFDLPGPGYMPIGSREGKYLAWSSVGFVRSTVASSSEPLCGTSHDGNDKARRRRDTARKTPQKIGGARGRCSLPSLGFWSVLKRRKAVYFKSTNDRSPYGLRKLRSCHFCPSRRPRDADSSPPHCPEANQSHHNVPSGHAPLVLITRGPSSTFRNSSSSTFRHLPQRSRVTTIHSFANPSHQLRQHLLYALSLRSSHIVSSLIHSSSRSGRFARRPDAYHQNPLSKYATLTILQQLETDL